MADWNEIDQNASQCSGAGRLSGIGGGGSWDVWTANHGLIAKAYAQKLSHGIDNNKNQLMPTL